MTGTYRINDTSDYHLNYLDTLGWELTVCNALEDALSPCRSVLSKKITYGNLLFDFLNSKIRMDTVSSLLEIGGGYGYVMRDFLKKMTPVTAAMLDLSPAMLAKQRETLKEFCVEFIPQNFLSADASFLSKYELVLMNEIIGDFPTLCGLDPRFLAVAENTHDPLLDKVKKMFVSYKLPVPNEPFNFNLGAVEAAEKLCTAHVRYVYISEHSSESAVLRKKMEETGTSIAGNPEQIRLKGHDEYTVRFSHLAAVADKFGYEALRGQYIDFIALENSGRLNFILNSNSSKDEHEMIRHFVEDLYKYEYLILKKD
jgi:hypothetical protein